MTPQTMSGSLAGIGMVGSLIGGIGGYESGQAQRSAYDYNADVTLLNTSNKMVANEQQYSTLVGRQASAYAASGVDIASGSPLLIMAATAARGAQQGKQIEQQGDEEAALQRYYGKVAAFQGTMGGIGSFLSGITQASNVYRSGNIPTPSAGSSDSTGDEGG